MVFIKHNSLKSDRFFNTIFIPYFSGSSFFKVQVFQGAGFSGSRFLSVRVQGSGPGFSGSSLKLVQNEKLNYKEAKCIFLNAKHIIFSFRLRDPGVQF